MIIMPGTENNEHDVSSLTFSDRGDLKYPIAKRLSILLPVSTQIQKQEQHNNSDDDDDDDNNNNNDNNVNNRYEYTDVTVDWYLWQVGERMHQDGLMKPFHKVRTYFY
mmetsp:Transcript_51553/g.57583  ORF Transcript_51553/g.57583 Transcript_51553/m.57583 type:complete len:108 (-) Transcript_51553:342-665(-)